MALGCFSCGASARPRGWGLSTGAWRLLVEASSCYFVSRLYTMTTDIPRSSYTTETALRPEADAMASEVPSTARQVRDLAAGDEATR